MNPVETSSSTRDRLIEAARELFLEHGFTGAGVAQILKKADARSGSLYHYFPTKEDLLLAVLESYKDLLVPIVMKPVFERISDPIERIFGVMNGYRQMLIMTECGLGCPIGNLALEVSDGMPNARKLISDNFSGWKKQIEQCLDAAAGRLPAEVDRGDLASFILTVMEGAVMQAKAYRTLEPFDTAVTQLRDYIERLLADGTDWAPRRGSEPPSP